MPVASPPRACRPASSWCLFFSYTSSILSSSSYSPLSVRLCPFARSLPAHYSMPSHMSTTPEIDELASPMRDDIAPLVHQDPFSPELKQEEEESKPLLRKKKTVEYVALDWPDGRSPSFLDDTWGKWVLRSTSMPPSYFFLLFYPILSISILQQTRVAISEILPCLQSHGGQNIAGYASIARIVKCQKTSKLPSRMRGRGILKLRERGMSPFVEYCSRSIVSLRLSYSGYKNPLALDSFSVDDWGFWAGMIDNSLEDAEVRRRTAAEFVADTTEYDGDAFSFQCVRKELMSRIEQHQDAVRYVRDTQQRYQKVDGFCPFRLAGHALGIAAYTQVLELLDDGLSYLLVAHEDQALILQGRRYVLRPLHPLVLARLILYSTALTWWSSNGSTAGMRIRTMTITTKAESNGQTVWTGESSLVFRCHPAHCFPTSIRSGIHSIRMQTPNAAYTVAVSSLSHCFRSLCMFSVDRLCVIGYSATSFSCCCIYLRSLFCASF